MARKHKVVQLNQATLNGLSDPNGNKDVVCAAVFYKNGEMRLFAPQESEANEITTDIKRRYDEVAENARNKSGLVASKHNPWTYVYTLNGVTYEITIHP